MTDKLPRVTASKVIKVLESTGFVMVRQSGSHKIFKNKKGVRITVPYHSGKVIHPKILKRILDDADLNIESFKELSK